ncbi:MAG: PLP-dependent transferase [Planctomycetes bacterium]|nr:PLP-dependent transferase [Planctomycetota bacterium]
MSDHLGDRDLHIDSLVIHGGQHPDPITGAVMPPISLSTTYAQESPGQHAGYEYTRSHNPTRYAMERLIARLEGSTLTVDDDVSCGGFAFSSGLAATATALELLDHGQHVIAMDDLYGGTYRLLTNVRERSQGLKITYVDLTDPRRVAEAITDETRMIWVETPTNPTLKLVDLEAIVNIARDRNIVTVCDNTFATPILQRPIEAGFDIAMHSATKYLGGHSDVLGGVLVTNRADLADRLRYLQNAIGSVMGPFDAYLCLRGIKTLALRMERHSASALRIAEWLERHPKVARVVYPGLASHPQHDLARRQMQFNGQPGFGGMITIHLAGGLDESRQFLENVRVFALAESLGGVESLIEHPAIMTHASVPPETRASLGISDSLIRISVGIEAADDLLADLEAALAAVRLPASVGG